MEGSDNILIGRDAGMHITTGSYNVGIGPRALPDVTTENGVIEIAGVRLQDLTLAEELVPLLRDYVRSLIDALNQEA